MQQETPRRLTSDTNSYWYLTYRRRNKIKEFIYNVFFGLSSWPRLVLEVFLRQNMGERYFSVEHAALVAIVLMALPVYFWGGYGSLWDMFWHAVKEHITWYLFVVAFIYFSYKRWVDVKDMPSVFEIRRFSLSSGRPFDIFLAKFKMQRITTIIEPGLAVITGLLLLQLFQLQIGLVLVVCGVIYSMSYFAAYSLGNDIVMDRLDEAICGDNFNAAFNQGKDVRYTAGFEYVGPRIEDPEVRERVMHMFQNDKDDVPDVR